MNWFRQAQAQIIQWIASPNTLRWVSDKLRRHKPIAQVGAYTIISRYDDVVETLANDTAFGVTEIYAERMARTTGDFFLGMENTPRYQREVEIARRTVHDDDLARIGHMVDDYAHGLIDAAKARGGAFDAVSDFTRLIPLRIVQRYFGVPGPDVSGRLAEWLRVIFWDIFLNQQNDPGVRERARAASQELRDHLGALIDQRKRDLLANQGLPDDFLTRLVRQQANDASIDDDLIRREVGGIVVGAVDTQSKAMAHVIDQLLSRPEAFDVARRAAVANDDATLSACVWEALRFNPHNPLLYRHCHIDTVLARGTPRETPIRKGMTVVPLTISAMFDPEAFRKPDQFRTDRDPSRYLHFGYGQHRCFGARINEVVLPRAIKAVLTLRGLRYDETGVRRIMYEGPFPDHMQLRFDATVPIVS